MNTQMNRNEALFVARKCNINNGEFKNIIDVLSVNHADVAEALLNKKEAQVRFLAGDFSGAVEKLEAAKVVLLEGLPQGSILILEL